MTKPPNVIFTLLVKSLLTSCKNFSTCKQAPESVPRAVASVVSDIGPLM